MTLDTDSCYRAMTTHDARFDGRFFVGVTSTRIYCRPVCTVRTPRRENCRFYPSAAAAEVAGFRPCLRCRPELAPGNAAIDAGSRLAQAAIRMIEDGAIEQGGVEHLAARIGVTSRHLRRIFADEFGVSPLDYAQTQRLLLAKRLLTDTRLPVTQVAHASGFASLRRFNASFQTRYRMAPTRLRRSAAPDILPSVLAFELAYRPPYDFGAMLDFLARRSIAGVESVDGRAYRRTLSIGHPGAVHVGHIEVRPSTRRKALLVRMSASLAHVVPHVLARTRQAFDVGCEPQEIAARLGELARERPGLRVPGGFDGFEIALRAIVGQQVSVRAATTLLGRIATQWGDPIEGAQPLTRTFPSAQRIASLPPAALAELGVLPARARTVVALAAAVANGAIVLQPHSDVEATRAGLAAIPGIGPWTIDYIVMRALGWPDAFLASDLGVLKALGETRPARALARAEPWRPWRAYAVMHLWSKLQ